MDMYSVYLQFMFREETVLIILRQTTQAHTENKTEKGDH